MSNMELFAIIILIVLLLMAFVAVGLLGYVLLNMKKRLDRYKGISDLESAQAKVKARTNQLQKKNIELEGKQIQLLEEEKKIKDRITELNVELGSLEDELDIQDYGLYEPLYDFGSSDRYKLEIDKIRARQKEMVRNDNAVIFSTEWTVSGSKSKGRKMMNEQTRLMLRAFNGECDSLIMKVKYNNISKIEARISSTYDAINKLGKTQEARINQEYFELKMNELHLVFEYQEKLQAEKEEQRQIQEQIREEQRAQREFEQAQQQAEKEEKQYQKALERARVEIEKATGEKQTELQIEIENLQQLLKEAQEKKERAISQAQMTKSGFVYVISNLGSFGENVYKIGMTRRLEPYDRVKELGDASVPFPFDVHAMISSNDAPSLENELHQIFDSRRVNRINLRKEFFNVTLEEIKKIVLKKDAEIEFTMIAEAEEYRKTKKIIARENGHPQTETQQVGLKRFAG